MLYLDIALYIIALLCIMAGLAGTIMPMLPGIPLTFAGLWLIAWVDDFAHAGVWTLSTVAAVGIIAMLLDFIAGALGAKRVGASRMAIWGALVGTIVGMFFGLLGLIAGPFLGALAGELSTGNSVLRSTHVSFATWVGMLLGVIAKIALTFVMLGIVLFAFLFT